MATAGDLLKRYGGAYLLTSTSLAVVSFSLCYWAVSSGVDIAALLQRVGIEVRARPPPARRDCAMLIFHGRGLRQVSSTSETAGTVGIAYAIHKAASPIRFPPTVALTPVVAKRLFGKEEAAE